MRLLPDSFVLRVVDVPKLAQGTDMEHSDLLNLHNDLRWVDGDLIWLQIQPSCLVELWWNRVECRSTWARS